MPLRLFLLCAGLLLCGCPGEDPQVGRAPPPPMPSRTPLPPGSPPSVQPSAEPSTTPGVQPRPSAAPSAEPSVPPSPEASPDPQPSAEPSPEASPAKPAKPERPITTEGAITRFPGIRVFKDEKRIEVDGYVNLTACSTLEFMGCTTRGKTHETLIRFECDPQQLHLSLLMLGLEPTPQVTEEGEAIYLKEGERVVMELAWWGEHTPEHDESAPASKKGVVRRRVEDLIWDKNKQAQMPRVGWVFTGSQMIKVPAPPDWDTLQEVYAASYEGNIVATYHHPFVILDTPLLEGGDDTVYIPFTSRVPARGTAVTIHVRAWSSADGPKTLPKPTPPKMGPPPPPDMPTSRPVVVPEDEEEVPEAPKDGAPKDEAPKDD